MPPLGYFGIESCGLNLVVDLLILFVVVLYLSLIYWTYTDARRRGGVGALRHHTGGRAGERRRGRRGRGRAARRIRGREPAPARRTVAQAQRPTPPERLTRTHPPTKGTHGPNVDPRKAGRLRPRPHR